MTIFRSTNTPPVEPAMRKAARCEACRRVGPPMLPALVDGERTLLCADPSDCRRWW